MKLVLLMEPGQPDKLLIVPDDWVPPWKRDHTA